MSAEIGGGNKLKSDPNVVPLCDILLVLLIIFMVITPMINKGANVELTAAENTAVQPKPGEMITIEVAKNNDIYLDDKKVIPDGDDMSKITTLIQDKITDKNPENKTKVLMKVDKIVPYGKVVDLMNYIKDAEIEIIGLITEKGSGS